MRWSLELPQCLRRIVSFVPAATDIVVALGRGDQLVGVSEECALDELGDLPRLTRARVDSNAQGDAIDAQVRELLARGEPLYVVDEPLLAELQPDVLLTQRQCSVCAVDEQDATSIIARLGLSDRCTVVGLAGETLAGVLRDVQQVGAAVGAEADAAKLVAQLRGRLAAVERRCADAQRMRVACIEWFAPLMIAGAWTPELIAAAGGRSELVPAGQHARTVDWSELADFDPELIILCPCGFDLERTSREMQALVDASQWRGLTAVQRGEVYLLDGNRALTTPGPGLIAVAELLAAWIRGEAPPRTADAPPWRRLGAAN